ncbi:MAG: penicillin-binding transpeptidase domain-containing protein, partial [Micrococcales bacterium]|nr:penicillin-binding transpeptidase domain-containing protein [Micrococcales bacterium]
TTDLPGKFKEALLAVKATRSSEKIEILGAYLNTIYFGRGAYGIQTAAQAYFGQNASDLTLSQAALLAGIIPAPSAWDPEVDLEQAIYRLNYVLDGMVLMDRLDNTVRVAQTFPEFRPYTVPDLYQGSQGYLLQMVRQELQTQAGLTDTQIDAAGLKVVTTINNPWQDAMVALAGDLPADSPEGLHIGIAAIDPSTGAITMLYGGPDYIKRQQNAATQDIAQAGSTFKPITLAAALEKGIGLNQTFNGNSPLDIAGWTVSNSGNTQYGYIDLVQATQSSVNTVFAQLNEQVGGLATLEAAVRAGLPVNTVGLESDLTNVLGTASPHVLDMARVYATFAAEGIRRDPYIVANAFAPDGGTVYRGERPGERAFEAEVIAEVDYALQRVVKYGTGRTVSALDRPVAGKTGTSENNQSAWFCGYTPQLAMAVAFYQSGPNGEVQSLTPFGENAVIQGGGPPAELWLKIMQMAMMDQPVLEFPERSGAYLPAAPPASPAEPEPPEPTVEPEPTTPAPPTQAPPTTNPTTMPPTLPASPSPVPPSSPPATTPPATTPPAEPSPEPTSDPNPPDEPGEPDEPDPG